MATAPLSIPSTNPTPATNASPAANSPEPSALDEFFEKFFDTAAAKRGGAPNLTEWVDLAEGWRIVRALREARGNRAAAARALGIGRRTLYTKMEKLGIAPRFSIW